jgi:hypothetical protein
MTVNNKKVWLAGMRVAGIVLACCFASSASAGLAVKADGFATELTSDRTPVDAISKGRMGVTTIYWVRWTGVTPGKPGKHRCHIYAPGESDPVFENEDVGAATQEEATTYCGFTPDRGYPSGQWRFVATLDGIDSVGEIEISEPPFIDRVGKWKIIGGIFALVVLGLFKLKGRA